MKICKISGLYLLFTTCFFTAVSQEKQVQYNAFQTDIQHIIMDYPNNFQHFAGEELVKNPQSTDYSSLLKIRGSEECRIIKRPSLKTSFYCFQSVLLTTDEFTIAKERYTEYYRQLAGLSVRVANQTFHFAGGYESPEEAKGTTGTVLQAAANDASGKRLKMELLLQYVQAEWKIQWTVSEASRDKFTTDAADTK